MGPFLGPLWCAAITSPNLNPRIPKGKDCNAQAGVDVAATLTAWGKWQPALAPGRGPSVAEALIGSLGGKGAERRVSAHTVLSSSPV